MKYQNIALTVIVILLFSIVLKLIHISALVNVTQQNYQFTKSIDEELMHSNHRLEKSFSSLIDEVKQLNDNLFSKEKGGKDAK